MRAFELLVESEYGTRLYQDLENVLMAVKGEGESEVRTDIVVRMMNDMGYAVTVGGLVNLLQSVPSISGFSQEIITFADTPITQVDEPVDSESEVATMALNAIK